MAKNPLFEFPAASRELLGQLFTKHPTPQTNRANRHVFLCHSSVDKPFVKKLGNDLDRLGVMPWIDEWEIGPGDSLFAKVGKGISQAAFFCIILSKESVSSKWCTMELEDALGQQLLNKTKIVPFKIDRVDSPPFLRAAHYLSLQRGQNRETLRLVAKIYGINERAVDAFLEMFPDPTIPASTAFLDLATVDHVIHFGKDWEKLQDILEKRGIDRSPEYLIRDRHGRDHRAK